MIFPYFNYLQISVMTELMKIHKPFEKYYNKGNMPLNMIFFQCSQDFVNLINKEIFKLQINNFNH